MGLAASQARLLSITSRLSDNELRTQLINNSKMRLATESSRVSEDYINALNSATMMMTNYDINGHEQTQALTFNTLTAYSPSNKQYGLVDTNGNILVSGSEAKLFEQSGGDLDTYLEKHNLKYTTSYFDKSTFGDWYDSASGLVNLKMENEDGTTSVYASYTPEELKAMYMGGTYIENVNGVSQSKTYPGYETSQLSSEYFNYLEKYQAYDSAVSEYVDNYWNSLNNYVKNNLNLLPETSGLNTIAGKDYTSGFKTGGTTNDLPSYGIGAGFALTLYKNKLMEFAKLVTPEDANLDNNLSAVLANQGYTISGDLKHVYQQVTENVPEKPYVTYKNVGGWIYVDDIRFGMTNVDHDGLLIETDAQGNVNVTDTSPENNKEVGTCNKYTQSGDEYIHEEVEGSNWHTSYNIVVTDQGITSTVVKFDFLDKNIMGFGSRQLVSDGSVNTDSQSISTNGDYICSTSHDFSNKNYICFGKTETITEIPLSLGNNQATRILGIVNNYAKVEFGYKEGENFVACPIGLDSNGDEITTCYVPLKTTADEEGNYYYTVEDDSKIFADPFGTTEYKVGAKVWDDDSFNNDVESYSLDAWKYLTDYYYVTDSGEMYNIQLTGEKDENGNSTAFDPYASGVKRGYVGLPGITGEYGSKYSKEYGYQTVYRYATGDEVISITDKMEEYFLLHLAEEQELFDIEEAKRIMNNCGQEIDFDALQETVYQYLDSLFGGRETDSNGNLVFKNDTYRILYEELWQSADKIGDMKWVMGLVEDHDAYSEILEDNEIYNSIKSISVVEQLFDTFGEPKMGWIDIKDNNSDGTKKAEWYTNLFNKMKDGYRTIENGLTTSKEWIQYALESGMATVVQVDRARNWTGAGYKNIKEITEVIDDKAVAIAEAEYNKAMQDIENKDKRFDMELKNIDTEHSALQQEYETIKSVISKNVERTFKIYS